VNVNDLITESTGFLAPQKLMESVKIETALDRSVGMVWADADQLKQVLINLMLNAGDAIEGSGSLTVSSKPVLRTEEVGPDEPSRGRIQISVADTGKGIASSEVNRIFDPFYTTKPPGEGTGLGLAISLRIIESFGGSIHVESTEGKGSTFTIELPLWEPSHDTK
jgi:signal transduction histidine kinase